MNVVGAITSAARSAGYREEAIVSGYTFADVLDPDNATREVLLAAFSQTPPSYRSAAFAAVLAGPGANERLVQDHRALGAPLLFVIDGDVLSLWQVRGESPRCLHEEIPVDEVPALFAEHRRQWSPDAIHRAKSIGAVDRSYQLDFVDIGLLPAVEGYIHTKLHQLLLRTLAEALDDRGEDPKDDRLLFHVVFRLLAAKVLHDRGHPDARHWDQENLRSVMDSIESYYALSTVPLIGGAHARRAFGAAWDCLRRGISFANISSDDLAFVYENTLVTPEIRKEFGTHSTPRQVAEYAVSRLQLHLREGDELDIYEPFAGAGVFLISALRHLRDTLPADWSDRRRHDTLIKCLSGDEHDPFACEVAMLSLILADYPNHNGWRIRERDLFLDGKLHAGLRERDVVLCNPPFEDFTAEERERYGLPDHAFSKPVEVLDATLRARPGSLAFVLPQAFIRNPKFARQRRRVEELYRDIELVDLPDRIFRESASESALLIARERRPAGAHTTTLRSAEVSGRGRAAFLRTGRTTHRRSLERTMADPPSGELWIPPLARVWEHLGALPRLGDRFEIHRGMEWNSRQGEAWSPTRKPGYRRGLFSARRSRQFTLDASPPWLDCRPDRVRGRSAEQPWHVPKVVVNGVRLSRGPWRMAAAVEGRGLLHSQQFIGLWQREAPSGTDLLAYAAVINGPVANAFVAAHSPEKRIRIYDLERIPVPAQLPARVPELVAEYTGQLEAPGLLAPDEGRLERLLIEIDAEILGAYDLPARLERDLLEHFREAARPVRHPWTHWNAQDPAPGLTLAERLAGRPVRPALPVHEIFRPLPPREAKLLRTYGS